MQTCFEDNFEVLPLLSLSVEPPFHSRKTCGRATCFNHRHPKDIHSHLACVSLNVCASSKYLFLEFSVIKSWSTYIPLCVCVRVERVIECSQHVDSHQVCKIGRGGDVVYKGIIASAETCCGSNDFPGTERVPARQGEYSGSEAERAIEILPVLLGAVLLCNSKQYELWI